MHSKWYLINTGDGAVQSIPLGDGDQAAAELAAKGYAERHIGTFVLVKSVQLYESVSRISVIRREVSNA